MEGTPWGRDVTGLIDVRGQGASSTISTHMRNTVGVVGLTTNENVGDYLLVESAKFLLRSHDPDTLLVDIDVDPRSEEIRSGRQRITHRVSSIMRTLRRPVLTVFRGPRFAYWYDSTTWRIRLSRHLEGKIKGLDALVFAGGGFIKFKTQGLNYLTELIIAIAQKNGVPVMMNAVGVEGYSDEDVRCQKLKAALNSGVVKMITTRDDIETLNTRYIAREGIVTERVGDPVFWLSEMNILDAPRTRVGRSRIGINLINPNNFTTYGGVTSRASIVNFYSSLIAELQARDADFYLFSNGMKVDQRFGEDLLRRMNLREDRLLRRPTNSVGFVRLVSDFDIILSARMHAGITAYALDVPVVGLIWGEKLQFFTRITGLRDRYFREDELDVKQIASLLIDNNLPQPDRALRSELRERTRACLSEFIDVNLGGPK